MVVLILFGYIGITYYKLHKEKVIYVIGMCAKDKSRLNSFHYLKNADDIRKELKIGVLENMLDEKEKKFKIKIIIYKWKL